jgi:hypothetical protein
MGVPQCCRRRMVSCRDHTLRRRVGCCYAVSWTHVQKHEHDCLAFLINALPLHCLQLFSWILDNRQLPVDAFS